jgi:hypothetical protein
MASATSETATVDDAKAPLLWRQYEWWLIMLTYLILIYLTANSFAHRVK